MNNPANVNRLSVSLTGNKNAPAGMILSTFIAKKEVDLGDGVAQLSTLTSPFFTVMDCLRGVISSLILDRKF